MYIESYTVLIFLFGYVFSMYDNSESYDDFVIKVIDTTEKVFDNINYLSAIIDGDIQIVY